MKAEIVITSGEETNRRYVLRAAQTFVIGRSPDVTIPVSDHEVSRRHCKIELRPDGGVYLTDLGSSNGTYLDGRRVESETPTRLSGSETISIGASTLQIDTSQGNEPKRPSLTLMRKIEESLPKDEFEVLCRLGSGSSGQIFAARQKLAKRMVAIKILHTEEVDPKRRERFLQEGQMCLRIQSRNVVTVYDVRPLGDTIFLVMELINGQSLAEYISGAEGPIEISSALAIAEQIAEGLADVHETGVIHRDVKPGNVLMTEGRRCKLTDFGIAKYVGRDLGMTDSGEGLGTVPYASPEQVLGDKDIGVRADIYGLGATLYHLLAGAPPFAIRGGQKVLEQIIRTPPPALSSLRPDVPQAVAALCHQMLEKDPAARPQTAKDVLTRLNQLRMLHHADPTASLGQTATQKMTAVPKHLLAPLSEEPRT